MHAIIVKDKINDIIDIVNNISLANAQLYIDKNVRDVCEHYQGYKPDDEIFKKDYCNDISCYGIFKKDKVIICKNEIKAGYIYNSYNSNIIRSLKIIKQKYELPLRKSDLCNEWRDKFNLVLELIKKEKKEII